MLKQISIIITIVIFSFTSAFAVDGSGNANIIGSSNAENFTKVGAAGGQFLKLGIGARGTGMAGAFSALADDLTAIHWNPAGVAKIGGTQAMFHHSQWFGGFSHNFAAVNIPVTTNYNFAVSFINFSSGAIPYTTIMNDASDRTYSVNDVAINLTFAGYLTDQFSFGITGKFVNLGFHDVSSGAFAFDVGTHYDTGIEGIQIALSLHNIGTENRYSGEALNSEQKVSPYLDVAPNDVMFLAYPFQLPITFRIGLAKDIYEDDDNRLTGAFDFITQSDVPEQFAFGLEYEWNDLVYVRGGYLIGHNQFGVAGGLGLKYLSGGFKGTIDYSINPTANLGLVNRFTVNVGF